MQPTRLQAEPAGPLRRLGAFVYDALLVVAIWMLTALLALPLNGGEAASGLLYQLVLVLEWIMFNMYFWLRQGQTLGMRAWRLKLVDNAGLPIAWHSAAKRLAIAPLSLLFFAIGYLWFYVGDRKQTWHDRVSDTFVVLLPKSAD